MHDRYIIFNKVTSDQEFHYMDGPWCTRFESPKNWLKVNFYRLIDPCKDDETEEFLEI